MKRIVITTLVTVSMQIAIAGTIVQWGVSGGEDVVTETYNMEYSGVSTLQTNTMANPALGVNGYYSGHSTDRSWKFYQAMTGASKSGDYYPNQVRDGGTIDYLRVMDMAGTPYPTITVFFWQKEDFLNGMSAEAVSLTSFYMEASTDDDDATFRWMVQDVGGSFYVSDYTNIVNNGGDNYGIYELTDLNSTAWYAFDPTTDIIAVGSEVVGLEFDDIAGVGFRGYTDGDSTHDYFRVRDFEVTAIPEPASIALLCLVFGVGFFVRRRVEM